MNLPATGFVIDGNSVGPGERPWVVAELSANHLGDLERAFAIMEAAAAAGASAIKLQTYTADTITIEHDGPGFRVEGGLWDGRTLHDLYQEAHTPWAWHKALFDKGRELGITVFSAPFDPTAVDLLESLGCPAYKIASFEAVDLPLIERVARTGKPVIISTGIVDRGEISEAVAAARNAGCEELALLHCVSAYPAPPAQSHVRTIPALADAFGVPVGLSDHTPGTVVSVAAVALGATIIEKHLALARADGGPDGAFSLEPKEFTELVRDCHTAAEALGEPYGPRESTATSRIFRRSLYVVADTAAGDRFTENNVRSIRPGWGLAPKYLGEILGRRAAHDLSRGTPLEWEMIDE